MSAMRFGNVNIPRSATVISAYLKISSINTDYRDQIYGVIAAEASDNPTDFSGRLIGDAALATASVVWDYKTAWSPDTQYTSPDISNVIQEVVNRVGFSSGNSIAIYYSTRDLSGKGRSFASYEYNPASAAVLEVTYETYTISGNILTTEAAGLEGVAVSAGADIESDVTDASGYYELKVPLGFSGTVTPSKADWRFTPANQTYSSVSSDKANEDYTAFQPAISGVTNSYGAALEGVALTASNGGGTTLTDSEGNYNLFVPYRWSGTVTPAKPQYTFTPSQRNYSNVTTNKISQSYTAILPPVSISGHVFDKTGNGIGEVNLVATNGGGNAVTDSNGYYEFVVPYNWTGNVAPSKTGWEFIPACEVYSSVLNNQISQNYTAIPSPAVQWIVRYSEPNGGGSPYAMVVDNVGNVYVTGYSYVTTHAGTNSNYITIKSSADGNELWVAHYNGPGNREDVAAALAVDNSGNVYVTGTSRGDGTGDDYCTIKYDANGNQIWVKRYNDPGNYYDYATDIAVDNSGNVYVTGTSPGSSTGKDYVTIKYAPNGYQIWAKRYNTSGYYMDDYAKAIAVDDLGNVYVTGESRRENYYDYATIKYNSNGILLWEAIYGGPGYDVPYDLVLDDFGNIYVTGEASGNYATVKYSSNGYQLWTAIYDGPNNCHDTPRALVVDKSGNVYVTGKSGGTYYYDGAYKDYATIKYDKNGNQLWVARYNGPRNFSDDAKSLAIDDSGNVYVTGSSHGVSGTADYATIGYDPNGNQLWVARYNGPENDSDVAVAIAADNSGNVYVTGRYYLDTIKYTQHEYCIEQMESDLNNDCKIDFEDYAIAAGNWLNGADWDDIRALVNHWLDCNFALEADCQ